MVSTTKGSDIQPSKDPIRGNDGTVRRIYANRLYRPTLLKIYEHAKNFNGTIRETAQTIAMPEYNIVIFAGKLLNVELLQHTTDWNKGDHCGPEVSPPSFYGRY